jgi:putative Holliday junction resolvase
VKILGIDWGEKRIGLALSDNGLAEPYGTVGSVEELEEVIRQEGIRQVVLGLPEGKHRKKVRELGRRLERELGMEVIFRNEVLSTEAALKVAVEAGKGKKARRKLDALAAAILLQEYLDSVNESR